MRPGWQPSGPVYEALVRRYVAPQARWLDIGCGRGGIVELLGEQVSLCAGVDPDHASLREHRAGHVRLCAGKIEAMPFCAGSFDLVTCSWVIEHLPRPALAFAHVARVLRPGGHFVFLAPNALNYAAWLNRLTPARLQRALVQRLYQRNEGDTFQVYYRANTPARLNQVLSECGLRRVEMHTVGDPTYVAFNSALFALGVLLERAMPASWRVHIVGDYVA